MKRVFLTAILLVFLLLGSSLSAQGWRTTLDFLDTDHFGWKVKPLANGDYIALTNQNGNRLVYLDAFGDTLWSKTIAPISTPYQPRDVIPTANGGFAVVSSEQSIPVLILTNAQGDTLQKFTVPWPGNMVPHTLAQSSDGAFVVTGANSSSSQGMPLIKVDSNGTLIWSRDLSAPHPGNGYHLEATLDGGFMVAGTSEDSLTSHPYLVRTDAQGDTLWTYRHQLTAPHYGEFGDLAQLADSGFIAAAAISDPVNFNEDILLVRLDPQGDTLWTRILDDYLFEYPTGLVATPDSGFTLLEWIGTQDKSTLVRFDAQGQALWSKDYPQFSQFFHQYGSLSLTAGEGYIFCGRFWNTLPFDEAIIIKTDSSGQVYPNLIWGNVYNDLDDDCFQDPGEVSLTSWVIKAENTSNGRVYYALTDSNGYYEMAVDTGSFIYGPDPLSPTANLWTNSTCSPLLATAVIFNQDTLNTDFARAPLADCPLMQVDLGTPWLRRCFPSTYHIQYANLGSATAYLPEIEISLGPDFTVTGSSIPWSSVSDTLVTFTFDSLVAQESGQLQLQVLLDSACNATTIGEVRCVSAHIFPDTSCFPLNPNWDGSSAAVSAECLQDTIIQLIFYNRGNAAMLTPSHVIIVEDNILRVDTNISLNSGDSIIWNRPGNGSTWYIKASQTPFHPGNSRPSAFIEACDVNAQGTFSTGFAQGYPLDNGDLFNSHACDLIRGAYDPNIKEVLPAGRGNEHTIDFEQTLDYTLHFQNTGNDTAFKVVIVDQLPPELSVGSIISGASSHPYTFEISGNGRATWTFDNILLPDSNVNEPGSRGFVRFRIDLAQNLPLETRINNAVDIYFDFNSPIRTDTAFVTLGEDSEAYIIVHLEEDLGSPSLKVFPNPFAGQATLDLGLERQDVVLEIFDLQGKLLQQSQYDYIHHLILQGEQLPNGPCFLRVTSQGQLIGTGKVMVMK